MKKLNSKGIGHLLVPILVFVLIGAIGGAYLLLKSHAATPATTASTTTTDSTQAPSAVASNFHICLSSAHSECLVSNGTGHQVSTKTSGAATWKQVSTRYSGYYTFQNSSGNCLSVSGTAVIIASGGCNQYNNNEVWRATTTPFQLKNLATQSFLATHGNDDKPVWVHDPLSGWYEGWDRL